MTSETAAQEEQPEEARQAENEDPLKAFGSIFRQQLDQAIEPIMENIRQHGQDTGQPATVGTPTPEAVSGVNDSAPPVLSLTVDRAQAEHALHAVLDVLLEALFSDDLQQVFRDRSDHAIQSLLAVAQDRASTAQALNVKPEQFAEAQDEFIEGSFSQSIQDKARRDGERVIRELIAWDGPAARKAGAKFLSNMAEQRFAAAEPFWQQVLTTVMAASDDETKPTAREASADAEAADSAPEDDIPQTLLRSDERAQEIWTKARDKVAAKGEPGAERAAYAALKQRYEKQGDHWVKKSRAKSES